MINLNFTISCDRCTSKVNIIVPLDGLKIDLNNKTISFPEWMIYQEGWFTEHYGPEAHLCPEHKTNKAK